jgi:hypothetical protein
MLLINIKSFPPSYLRENNWLFMAGKFWRNFSFCLLLNRKQSTNKLPKPQRSLVWKNIFNFRWRDSEVIFILYKVFWESKFLTVYHFESIHGLHNPTKLNLVEQVHTPPNIASNDGNFISYLPSAPGSP